MPKLIEKHILTLHTHQYVFSILETHLQAAAPSHMWCILKVYLNPCHMEDINNILQLMNKCTKRENLINQHMDSESLKNTENVII
jgi:hypothetical protein